MGKKITPGPDTISEVFGHYIQKLGLLDSQYGLKATERNKIVADLIVGLLEIKIQYLKEWHTIEGQIKVIQKLEYYLEVFGHDMDSIRSKIQDDVEIQDHLTKGLRD